MFPLCQETSIACKRELLFLLFVHVKWEEDQTNYLSTYFLCLYNHKVPIEIKTSANKKKFFAYTLPLYSLTNCYTYEHLCLFFLLTYFYMDHKYSYRRNDTRLTPIQMPKMSVFLGNWKQNIVWIIFGISINFLLLLFASSSLSFLTLVLQYAKTNVNNVINNKKNPMTGCLFFRLLWFTYILIKICRIAIISYLIRIAK